MNDYERTFPVAGGAAAIALNQSWMVAAAVAIVLTGAVAIRLWFRRGKWITDK